MSSIQFGNVEPKCRIEWIKMILAIKVGILTFLRVTYIPVEEY